MDFIIRETELDDIDQIMFVRTSVKENVLSNPDLVTHEDCKTYLTQRGKGWVAICDDEIVGFAIIELKDDNVWALFLLPDFENKGIGKTLHDTMLQWYFNQGKNMVYLSTEPQTRAEGFYRKQLWVEKGLLPNGEIKFEMSLADWQRNQNN